MSGTGFGKEARRGAAFTVFQRLLAFAAACGSGGGQQAGQRDFFPAVLAEWGTSVTQKVQQALQAANALRVVRGAALGQMDRRQMPGRVQFVGAGLDLKSFAQERQARPRLSQFVLNVCEGVIHDPSPYPYVVYESSISTRIIWRNGDGWVNSRGHKKFASGEFT